MSTSDELAAANGLLGLKNNNNIKYAQMSAFGAMQQAAANNTTTPATKQHIIYPVPTKVESAFSKINKMGGRKSHQKRNRKSRRKSRRTRR